MVKLIVMSCMWVNAMLFCAESTKTRQEVFIPKTHIEMFRTQEYRFVKDLNITTITRAIYNDKATIAGDVMQGCKISTVYEKTTAPESLYSEFPCNFTMRLLKDQE